MGPYTKIEFWEMMAGPSWSSIRSVTTRSENACRRMRRSTSTLCRLGLGGRVIFLQRNRARAGVLRHLKAFAGKLLSRRRQQEIVVVAGHALDFHQLLGAHVLENSVDHRDGEAQRPAQAGQARIALDQQAAQNQIQNQRFRDAQLFEVLRERGVKGGTDRGKSGHRVGTFLQKSYRQKGRASLLWLRTARLRQWRRHIFLECLLRNTLILLVLAVCCQADTEANRLFREGQRAEHAGDKLHAYMLYARAVALDPANLAIRQGHSRQPGYLAAKTRADSDIGD